MVEEIRFETGETKLISASECAENDNLSKKRAFVSRKLRHTRTNLDKDIDLRETDCSTAVLPPRAISPLLLNRKWTSEEEELGKILSTLTKEELVERCLRLTSTTNAFYNQLRQTTLTHEQTIKKYHEMNFQYLQSQKQLEELKKEMASSGMLTNMGDGHNELMNKEEEMPEELDLFSEVFVDSSVAKAGQCDLNPYKVLPAINSLHKSRQKQRHKDRPSCLSNAYGIILHPRVQFLRQKPTDALEGVGEYCIAKKKTHPSCKLLTPEYPKCDINNTDICFDSVKNGSIKTTTQGPRYVPLKDEETEKTNTLDSRTTPDYLQKEVLNYAGDSFTAKVTPKFSELDFFDDLGILLNTTKYSDSDVDKKSVDSDEDKKSTDDGSISSLSPDPCPEDEDHEENRIKSEAIDIPKKCL